MSSDGGILVGRSADACDTSSDVAANLVMRSRLSIAILPPDLIHGPGDEACSRRVVPLVSRTRDRPFSVRLVSGGRLVRDEAGASQERATSKFPDVRQRQRQPSDSGIIGNPASFISPI